MQKIIDEVKTQQAPDKRQAVFEVKAEKGKQGTAVSGKVSDCKAYCALNKALAASGEKYTSTVTLLPDTLWALPLMSVAHVRTAPSHAAEMATQVLMGMPIRLLEKQGEWWRVQCPDGYIGYVNGSGLAKKTPEEMERWRSVPRLVVTAPYQVVAYKTADAQGLREVVTDLVNGNIVERAGAGTSNGRIRIALPDGRTAWVAEEAVTPIELWAAQPFNADQILDQAYSMEGAPYFWGGTSIKNLDCSGLAKVSYLSNGIILMRDASQQALTGGRIEAADWRSCQPGDLLFFGNAKTGKVTHVAIYDHDGNYVHSSGRVKRNSVDPESPAYLTTPFLHATRIAGHEGTPASLLPVITLGTLTNKKTKTMNRRNFLRTAALSAAAMAVSPISFSAFGSPTKQTLPSGKMNLIFEPYELRLRHAFNLAKNGAPPPRRAGAH